MRNPGFIAAHLGGPLSSEQHRELMAWAICCATHAQHQLPEFRDERLISALAIAAEWIAGRASVGDARRASVAAHAAAREAKDPVSVSIGRAIGHTVATAHMADHALGGALYALKALQAAGRDISAETAWQDAQLPAEIADLVRSTLPEKAAAFKLAN